MKTNQDDTNNEMVTHYVYELNNGKGGSYFGVTKNPKRRVSEHRNLKAKSLTSSVKLGKNFEMKILQEYDNLVDARLSEELLIRNCCCVNDHIPSNIIVQWNEGEKKLITEHIQKLGIPPTPNVLVLKRKYIIRTIKKKSKHVRGRIGKRKIIKLYK